MILTGGTVVARAIAALASPVISRIYPPSDFGLFSVFFSLTTALIIVAALNYEAAIPLPKDDEFGLNIMGLSFCLLFLNTLICGLVLFLFGHSITVKLGAPQLQVYLWLIPLSLLGGGAYFILNSWAIRVQAFRSLAKRRIIQSAFQVLTQLSVPLLIRGPFGLLLGDTVGRASGSITLALDTHASMESRNIRLSVRRMAEAAVRYKKFPFFGTASVLAHASFSVLPALLMTRFFGLQEAGWYALVNQVLGVALGLIGLAVAQVYLSNAVQLARSSPLQLRSLFLKTSRAALLAGIVPLGLLIPFGPQLFGFVFGARWVEAGRYAQLLALPFLAMLTVGPVYPTLTVLERQDWQFAADALGMLIMILGMRYAHSMGLSGRWAVGAYGISVMITYLSLFVLALFAIQRRSIKSSSTGTPKLIE
ncbi:MAG: lipopolysaccharide biosynthesis protein [Candidatus Acidiferrales bacterium]